MLGREAGVPVDALRYRRIARRIGIDREPTTAFQPRPLLAL